jgi:hypothetical protein
MRELNDLQKRALERGLEAFDAAQRARRNRRAVTRVLMVALTLGAGITISRGFRAPARRLPDYVQVISEDSQLAAELSLANACERFERTEGRLVVVECSLPRDGSPGW